MKYNIVFQNERPIVVAGERHAQKGGQLIEVPSEFNVHRAGDWRLDNGVLVYDPVQTECAERPVETNGQLTLEERVAILEETLKNVLTKIGK